MGLAARAALVTGGSSGIGLAIAKALGEDGYGVTVAARRPEKLEGARAELEQAGVDVQAVPAQMTDEEEIHGAFASHQERFGRLDVLVNNAGIGIGAPMADIQTKHLDIQLGVNLRAVVIGTRQGLPMLREAGAEHGKALIVNMASVAGKSGQPWLSVYSATKAAVIGVQPVDAEGGAERRDPGDGALPRVRRYADDGVREGAGGGGGDDPPGGHRRVGAVPAADLAGVPRAGGRVPAAGRGARRRCLS